MVPDVGLDDGQRLGDVEAGHVATVGSDLVRGVELDSVAGISCDPIDKGVANEVVKADLFILDNRVPFFVKV